MDLNVRSFRVAQAAMSEQLGVNNKRKESARKGDLKGGPSRAKAIHAAQRSEGR
jgi:hypothetical protein